MSHLKFQVITSSDFNSNEGLKSVSDDDLPEEFKKWDYPFGIPQHVANSFSAVISHLALIYYLSLIPLGLPFLWITIATMTYSYIGGLGITVGAHRYWTHKTFKANKPLQILLMIMQTIAMQYPIFKWCRDHRVHHKYTDTNADPHSSARGFWFSHMMWLFQPRHPDVIKSFKTIDISDLARDPIVRFQSRHFGMLIIVFRFIIPMGILHLFFPDFNWIQLLILNIAGWIIMSHLSSLVNSIAHKWGDRPYDKWMTSTDNALVTIFVLGEGWHNYHHTFPWDYKAAEFGYKYNLSTVFIHFFAWIGWACDLKTVSHKLLVDRINRTGSKSHPFHKNHNQMDDPNKNYEDSLNGEIGNDKESHLETACWGWGDKELKKEDVEITTTLFPMGLRKG